MSNIEEKIEGAKSQAMKNAEAVRDARSAFNKAREALASAVETEKKIHTKTLDVLSYIDAMLGEDNKGKYESVLNEGKKKRAKTEETDEEP